MSGKVKLKKLSISLNWIGSMTLDGLLNLKMLECFSIKQNSVVVDNSILYLAAVAQNLTYLDVSCQYNYGCSDVYPWATFLPGVPVLFHKHAISEISVKPLKRNTVSVFVLSKLHTLKMSYDSTDISIPSFCWADNHLVNIDISHSKKLKINL